MYITSSLDNCIDKILFSSLKDSFTFKSWPNELRSVIIYHGWIEQVWFFWPLHFNEFTYPMRYTSGLAALLCLNEESGYKVVLICS